MKVLKAVDDLAKYHLDSSKHKSVLKSVVLKMAMQWQKLINIQKEWM